MRRGRPVAAGRSPSGRPYDRGVTGTEPLSFLKGHGTENDFVIIPDPDGHLELSAAQVARLCDRRAGLGGDGVLRVVRSQAHPEAREMADQAPWFMDYRNSDGSVAEMCGNGVRVFARYLRWAGLVPGGELAVATRAGVRRVRMGPDAVTVAMGRARLSDERVTVRVADRSWPARPVDLGNPHAVAFVEALEHVGDLVAAPEVAPAAAFPEGVNVEFVTARAPRRMAMRVHERGSGETRSCGTGACAVMVAAARRDGVDPAVTGDPVSYQVEVAGGLLTVTEHPDGVVDLTGPAVIVAQGTVDPEWLNAVPEPLPGTSG